MEHLDYLQEHPRRRLEIRLVLLLVFGFCWINGAAAAEVYKWTDKDGVVHFSDMPTQSGDAEIINVEGAPPPGSSSAYADVDAEQADPSGESDNPMTENPATLAEQRREQIAADRKERNERQAEITALCAQNQQLLERLEPSRRVYFTDAKGEEVRMDDEQRVALVEEAKDFVAENCQ